MILRTFIAIDLPAPLHEAIRATQAALAQELDARLPTQATPEAAGLHWTHPESTHLTLRFIGDTPTDKIQPLAHALQSALATMPPLVLQLRGLGCFPNLRRPRVIWLGLNGQLEQLAALQSAVEDVVRAAGFAPETQPYQPHLTLARTIRAVRPAQLARLGEVLGELRAGDMRAGNMQAGDSPFVQPVGAAFTVSEVIHFQSELPGGKQGSKQERGPRQRRGLPVYTPLTRVSLASA
ncbi:MAG: RNA 2',3'-cyclic phosphodiesterase [Litorilinea sp.]